MPDISELLARFHHALVGEIRESRPDYLHAPFTVAEIYQNLVPYRSHRDVIGVEMNGDYEDALLRLLAGEGDYLFLESDVARREIREELQTGNPNTGLFRDFAAADVRLNPAKIDFAGPVLVGEATTFEFAPSEDPDGADGSTHDFDEGIGIVEIGDFTRAVDRLDDVAASETVMVDGEVDDPAEIASSEEGSDEADLELSSASSEIVMIGSEADSAELEISSPDEGLDLPDAGVPATAASCQWCRAGLPEREEVKFCPFCGSDLDIVACIGCGQELELHWRFCIACGTEAPA